MPTATENLVEAIITGLSESLPDLLAAQDLPIPGDGGYSYGEPELKPTSRTPYVSVDVADLAQREISIGGGLERDYKLVVYAIISGPDPETVARELHRWADCLITAIEGLAIAGITHFMAERGDFSPNLRGGNVLFRGVMIDVTAIAHRAFGSAP